MRLHILAKASFYSITVALLMLYGCGVGSPLNIFGDGNTSNEIHDPNDSNDSNDSNELVGPNELDDLNLSGTWQYCEGQWDDYSALETLHFNVSSLQLTYQYKYFSTIDCSGTAKLSLIVIFAYEISEGMVALELLERRMQVDDRDFINDYNEDSYCGKDNWVVGEDTDLTEAECGEGWDLPFFYEAGNSYTWSVGVKDDELFVVSLANEEYPYKNRLSRVSQVVDASEYVDKASDLVVKKGIYTLNIINQSSSPGLRYLRVEVSGLERVTNFSKSHDSVNPIEEYTYSATISAGQYTVGVTFIDFESGDLHSTEFEFEITNDSSLTQTLTLTADDEWDVRHL